MASGEPSPCLMKQMQQAICQICGRDMEQSSNKPKVNYQKQVDEPNSPYTQIIPDYRYEESESCSKQKKEVEGKEEKKIPFHVCIAYPMSSPPSKIEANSVTKDVSAGKDAENSTTTKAACLPTGGGCPPPVKMMLCLPCPPPDAAKAGSQQNSSRKKPKDYTYRCESRELRGGNLYHCCQCNKRNGLQHDCPRTPCQGRPACLTKPWPDCWPSGGSHGIDYSRENGVKRYNPCLEQRFDKRENKAPTHLPKADCGGNMMIVVCPAPQTS